MTLVPCVLCYCLGYGCFFGSPPGLVVTHSWLMIIVFLLLYYVSTMRRRTASHIVLMQCSYLAHNDRFFICSQGKSDTDEPAGFYGRVRNSDTGGAIHVFQGSPVYLVNT